MEKEMEQFYVDLFGSLPRCGPGSVETTRKAYSFLKKLPKNPKILDIGVGTGMSTIELAKISAGSIIAIDVIESFLRKLRDMMKKEDVNNIIAHNMSMDEITLEKESFDIIWSEGSIFIMGFERGLEYWRKFLKPNGYLAVSDMVWFDRNAPEDLKQFMEHIYEEFPKMLGHEQALTVIENAGYELITYFKLDVERDWWDNFYRPMEVRVPQLKKKYDGNGNLLAALEMNAKEMTYFKHYSDFYGYMFYVLQKK